MVKEEGKFKWLEEGTKGQPIILLHGLMGGVENFGEMVDYISEEYKVYGLDLKLFEGKLLKVSVKGLSDYLYEFMEHLGLEKEVGFEFELRKKMPFGTGLGSSAASSVAGVMAVNEILNRPLTKREILPFAMLGEQAADGAYHSDNVAPSLLGGIIFCRDNPSLDIHRIYAPKGLYATVVLPELEILTKDSRNVLLCLCC